MVKCVETASISVNAQSLNDLIKIDLMGPSHYKWSQITEVHTVNIYRHVSSDSIVENFVNSIQRLCLFNK